MSNKETGLQTIEVAGTVYRLQFTINALCTLEAELGADNVTDIQAMIGEQPSITTLRTLFWCGLQEHHPGTTKETAGKVMGAIGLVKASELMTSALLAALGHVIAPGADGPLADAAA